MHDDEANDRFEALERLSNLFDHSWDVIPFGDWVLVSDLRTTWWCKRDDITGDLMDAAGTDYQELCDLLDGYQDDAIPMDVLAEAREWYGLDDDEPVARGW